VTAHNAQDVLSNAGRLLRSYADASIDAIYIKDRNSRWRFANPALERITGKPAAELLGKTDAEIYSNPEVGKAILENDKKVMDSGKPETFEEVVALPDGLHFFVSVKSPRFDENGKVTGLMGISHDITNRKKREEQLRESQKKYLDLIETTGDFIWEMDSQGRYTYCSPQMERLWGINPASMLGKTPFNLMPPNAKEKSLEFFMALVGSAKPFNGLETVSYNGKGQVVFLEISGVPFFDKEKKLLGYRGITRDVTERRNAEEALRKSEEKYRHLVEYAPTGIYEIDFGSGRVVSVNDAMCQYLGYTEQELLTSVNGFDILDKQSQELFKDRIKKNLSGQPIEKEIEYSGKTKDGRTFWTLLNVKLIFKEGKPSGAFVVAQDITKRKKVEEELGEYRNDLEKLVEQRTRQLKESERLATIGATAGMVGHDIRNPLQAIVGDIYFTKKTLNQLPESQQKQSAIEDLDAIEQNVDYINKIVQDLQDYARPITPSPREVDIETIIEEAIFKNYIPKNIDASCQVEKEAKKLVIDADVLKRILGNLTNNAIQAMPKGGKLTVYAYPDVGGNAVIEVSDTGMGISEDTKQKLFIPLFTTKSKGQGFGLAVVKRLTEALGGTVDFESELGKGSKFILRLPTMKNKR
jgi:PAS domain S-box-containing protein